MSWMEILAFPRSHKHPRYYFELYRKKSSLLANLTRRMASPPANSIATHSFTVTHCQRELSDDADPTNIREPLMNQMDNLWESRWFLSEMWSRRHAVCCCPSPWGPSGTSGSAGPKVESRSRINVTSHSKDKNHIAAKPPPSSRLAAQSLPTSLTPSTGGTGRRRQQLTNCQCRLIHRGLLVASPVGGQAAALGEMVCMIPSINQARPWSMDAYDSSLARP